MWVFLLLDAYFDDEMQFIWLIGYVLLLYLCCGNCIGPFSHLRSTGTLVILSQFVLELEIRVF